MSTNVLKSLDVFLSQALEEVPSRTFVKKLIDAGHVKVNSKVVKANHKVTEGDEVSEEFSKTSILIEKATGDKCSRCWNLKMDVGQDTDHKTLCARCTAIVKEFS